MGLLNYIKGTIKENYDLEDIEDIEDIDDFVYDDEQNTGEEQNADNSRTEDLTGLVSEFEKNYQKHEKKAKAPQKKNKKVSSEEKIQEQRRKAKEEEKKYDELLNSVQAKSLIHVVDKMNQAGTQENYSGKLAKEEKEETEYLKQLEKEEEKKRIQEKIKNSMPVPYISRMYPEHRAVWTILIRITTIKKKQKPISAASVKSWKKPPDTLNWRWKNTMSLRNIFRISS